MQQGSHCLHSFRYFIERFVAFLTLKNMGLSKFLFYWHIWHLMAHVLLQPTLTRDRFDLSLRGTLIATPWYTLALHMNYDGILAKYAVHRLAVGLRNHSSNIM